MTIKELEYDIKEIQATLEKKQKELDEAIKTQTIWKPEKDETYFFIESYGGIGERTHLGFEIDYERINIGNYYKTYKEAEFEAECEKYTRLYRRYVETHDDDKANWESNSQLKWYMFYDSETHTIDFGWTYHCKSVDVYASNKEVLKDAVEFIGEGNFKKYVLRIKE